MTKLESSFLAQPVPKLQRSPACTTLAILLLAAVPVIRAQDWGPMHQTTVDGQPVAYHFRTQSWGAASTFYNHLIGLTNLGTKKLMLTSVIHSSDGSPILLHLGTLDPAITDQRMETFTDAISEPEMIITGHVINDDTEIKWSNWTNDAQDSRCQHAIGIQRKDGHYVHWLTLKDIDPNLILDIKVWNGSTREMLASMRSTKYQADFKWSYVDDNPQANFSWSVVAEAR